MKKYLTSIIVFSAILLSSCNKNNITITGDNTTVNTNTENNNGKNIIDTDANINVDVTNDKSKNNTIDDPLEFSIESNEEYQRLLGENEKLKDQIKILSDEIKELKNKSADLPIVEYSSLSLFIDGENVPINTNNSMVYINGKEYLSREIVENIIPDNQSLTINDNTLFVGRVIANLANLTDFWIVDQSCADTGATETDSYGNVHKNVISLYGNSCYIIYNLNREYELLSFNLSVNQYASKGKNGIITVKADDNIIYVSPEITRLTEPFDIKDISINNCSLLSIEYNSTGSNKCIISDAIVYN